MLSLALLPLFVWMTQRVGRQRKRITSSRQTTMADMSSLVQESLSVSGILLGKTMGRSAELASRFERESENLADLEVRSRMAVRWMMAFVQTTFAVMPALVYLFAGIAPGAASVPARSQPTIRRCSGTCGHAACRTATAARQTKSSLAGECTLRRTGPR